MPPYSPLPCFISPPLSPWPMTCARMRWREVTPMCVCVCACLLLQGPDGCRQEASVFVSEWGMRVWESHITKGTIPFYILKQGGYVRATPTHQPTNQPINQSTNHQKAPSSSSSYSFSYSSSSSSYSTMVSDVWSLKPLKPLKTSPLPCCHQSYVPPGPVVLLTFDPWPSCRGSGLSLGLGSSS